MSGTKITWAVLALVYVAFFSWYTSFGGPLSDEEIAYFTAKMDEIRPDRSPEERARGLAFMKSDTGDDFVMWNTIEMHETPLPVEGVEPGETSADVLAKYMEYMWPALLKRACHPVFMADAAAPSMDHFGMTEGDVWTRGAGMRYRSRRDVLDIATNPAFQGSHEFKIAAMKKTFAFPGDPWFHFGDPRLLLALIFLLIGLTVSLVAARS